VIVVEVRESGGRQLASNSRVESGGLRQEAVRERGQVKLERVTTISTDL
jgi:hypothetical protein